MITKPVACFHLPRPQMSQVDEKVIFIGDSGVGKTSIIKASEGEDISTTSPTIASSTIKICRESSSGNVVPLALWDTAGQETYQALVPSYARGAVAAVIVFAVNDSITFESLEAWKGLLNDHAEIEHFFLVGNKTDLERSVQYADGEAAAKKLGCKYFECSAATGQGVNELVMAIVDAVDPQKVQQKREKPATVDLNGEEEKEKKEHKKKSGCC